MQLFADLYDAIVAFPKPTIAACHGDVVGGGAEIAIACDMRVGGSNLRMRFPGAALGVPVGPGPPGHPLRPRRRQVPAALLAHGRRRRGAAARPRQPGRPGGGDRGGGAGARRRGRRPPARGGRPPEADAARVGRRRGPLARPRARARSSGSAAAPACRAGDRRWRITDQSLTVAVTGPTGEIGKPFLAALERVPEVERVIGMARRPFDIAAHGWEKAEYRRGDVLDRDSVEALVEEADVVVHLAFVDRRRRRARAARST